MHFPRFLWMTALLCMAVHSVPTNYTLDDTSPVIAYTGTPSLRCAPGVCDWSPQLHDGTSTVTNGPITIHFTGSAVYVYLGMGACTIHPPLTGHTLETSLAAQGNISDEIFLAFMNESMPDVPHVLTIGPRVGGLACAVRLYHLHA
ncbi:hypothetical protein MVEN_01164800 [Mycena venus]|uniref:Uncharacterized protein n=1 Tax=Mycena venus TaxID=2733690 RepID=A0A8H6Y5G4_9AGAR|nr:hypothetical protein MVEN_01164800 [Mycena venus]